MLFLLSRQLVSPTRRTFAQPCLRIVHAQFALPPSRFALTYYHRPSLFRMVETQDKPASRPREPQRKKKKGNAKTASEGTNDEVLQLDVTALLKRHAEDAQNGGKKVAPVVHAHDSKEFPETELTITELSSVGDGLALSPHLDHVYVVPFTVPGDVARVKVVRTMHKESYSLTDLLEVIKPGPQRDDSLINCQYFAKCSGCQLQMLPYEDQLKHKKRIIEKAYANFSGILPELIPTIRDTMGSPLQYGYRTKLTPHFTVPGGRSRGAKGRGQKPVLTEVPPIGFMIKGRRTVMDIEDCPLGTDIVRRGLKRERKRVAEQLDSFKNGATLLMRESTTRTQKTENEPTQADDKANNKNGEEPQPPTERIEKGQSSSSSQTPARDEADVLTIEHPTYIEEKRCITNPNATTFEYVDDYIFQNRAGQFFQNNNSILPPFTAYIRENVHQQIPTTTASDEASSSTSVGATPAPKLKYLLDAYSGSGLFTVTLSPLFISSLGIDISTEGIAAARENARQNNLANTGFAAADAPALFRDVPYPPDQTLLVIDPPRKGCGDDFLMQLLAYGPRRVIYVSCNVHTQARDVGVLVQGSGSSSEGKEGVVRYELESIKGFDFFPQTGHVESVAVLNRV
ncbi:hypothetical protein AJ80_01346 [Polytolypa hystricis UAMH7299]|uniref:TRAM domain-containing protein n=1 Tax=Polytolypa hystricis (strain UAMH7299) TaxID=1447883 RepID=A0A2B7Z1K7_POLH7|nr:hypothetical protein AJ80_01346 [Polytolypa hystricis UAMH7299]